MVPEKINGEGQVMWAYRKSLMEIEACYAEYQHSEADTHLRLGKWERHDRSCLE